MSVPVLMYHHVLPKSGSIAIGVNEFEAQMKMLAENSYNTITPKELELWKTGQITLPKKSVLITFDDGWRDNFIYAYPVLKKYNLKATIFLVTGWINAASEHRADFEPLEHEEAKKEAKNKPGALFLNWDEVAQMSDIISFHSHTHGHTDGYFGSLPFDEDLELCKNTIKTRLGFDDTHLCWPRGQFDDERLKIAKNIGYKVFYTTIRGTNQSDNKLDEIKRIAIKNSAFWLKKSLFIYSSDAFSKLYSTIKVK